MRKKIAIIITSIISGFSLLCSGYFFSIAFKRVEKELLDEIDPEKMNPLWRPHFPRFQEGQKWYQKQNKEKIKILSQDGLALQGMLLPCTNSKKIILAVHGFHSNGSNDYAIFAPFYQAMGYQMLLVDARAHGESEGNYIGFGVHEKYDCICWIQYLVERFGEDCQIVLHGISMGGATVLMTGGEKLPSQVKGIISDCSYSSAKEEFKYLMKNHYHLPVFPILHMTTFMAKLKAGFSIKECSVLEQTRKIEVPVLFIHGEADDFVPTWMVYRLYNACNARKHLALIHDASHAISYYVDPEKYEYVVGRFLYFITKK